MKKAIEAGAHQILGTASTILRDQSVYRELGGDLFDRQHSHRTQNRLERLGLQVVITPAKSALTLLHRCAFRVAAPINVSDAELIAY